MIRNIVLHGHLKEVYQDDIRLECSSMGEAIRACCYQIDGFKEALHEGSYEILFESNGELGEQVQAELVHFNLGDHINAIHITPAIEGAKSGGGKAIIGAVLIAASFAIPGSGLVIGSVVGAAGPTLPLAVIGASTVAKLGVAMLLGGVAQLLAPDVDSGDPQTYEKPEAKASFLFNGPVNTAEQGGPVPLVYGRVITGSHVVSSGLSTEKI